MKVPDPCPPADQQVCAATRRLALALLRRIRVEATKIEPRIRTLIATRHDPGYALWRVHDAGGRLLLRYDLLKQPDPAWDKLTVDLSLLARLADLRTHPPGYYYVHPLPDPRDIAVPLPANPRGLPPRTIGRLQ
ncbi:hypothetical protein [Streptomyces sp. NPDC048825]|uniref:hypothetical protein n=1 Tax=Streptomyces sp. NPDC048825 TaxID=3365592 RepID=UPI003710611A